jgi:hypothetical protein
VEGAPENLRLADEPVAHVDEQGAHHLLIPDGVLEDQVPDDGESVVHRRPPGDLGMGQAPGQLQRSEHRGGLRFSQSPALEPLGVDAHDPEQAVRLGEDLPGEVQVADLPTAVAEEDGQDLRVGEGVGAGAEQALAGALVRGEVPDEGWLAGLGLLGSLPSSGHRPPRPGPDLAGLPGAALETRGLA